MVGALRNASTFFVNNFLSSLANSLTFDKDSKLHKLERNKTKAICIVSHDEWLFKISIKLIV
ncbi:hypothetical protein D210916BOD24_12440 [Alteromonas sp. D210916BOD_24]